MAVPDIRRGLPRGVAFPLGPSPERTRSCCRGPSSVSTALRLADDRCRSHPTGRLVGIGPISPVRTMAARAVLLEDAAPAGGECLIDWKGILRRLHAEDEGMNRGEDRLLLLD